MQVYLTGTTAHLGEVFKKLQIVEMDLNGTAAEIILAEKSVEHAAGIQEGLLDCSLEQKVV